MSKVTIKGADRLAATLATAAGDLRDLTPVNAEAGEHVAETARRNAPRRSGTLAGAISSLAAAGVVTISAATAYAGVIDRGWPRRNIAPQPYLTPAAEDEDGIAHIYLQALTNTIGKIRGT